MDKKLYDDEINAWVECTKEKYGYLRLSDKEVLKIVKEAIGRVDVGTENGLLFSKKLEEIIDSIIDKIIVNMLKNNDTALEMISEYIKYYNIKIDNYDNAILWFTKIILFLQKYNYAPGPDMLVTLIRSNIIFRKMIELIVNENINLIKAGKASDIFNSNLSVLIIETCCELNDIKIKSEELVTDDVKEVYVKDQFRAYVNEIIKYPLLSVEEEKRLGYLILEGNSEAREKLIESNLRLVVSIAKRFHGKTLAFMDLIQEGNAGLAIAASRFDVRKGYKFSTYATWWIKQAIMRALDDSDRIIRIPVEVSTRVNKYKKVVNEYLLKYDKNPSRAEVAKIMGLELSEVKTLEDFQKDAFSLSTKIAGDLDDIELGDTLVSDDVSLDEMASLVTLTKIVDTLLKKAHLNERQMMVLRHRYGLDGEPPKSHEEIRKMLGVTRERVRQIEAIAIRKLRLCEMTPELAHYMDYPDAALKRLGEMRTKYAEITECDKFKLNIWFEGNSGRTNNIVLEEVKRRRKK